MESVLKHLIHLRSTADPEFLAGDGETFIQELLVPAGLLGHSVGQAEVELEVLRLHLLQKLQKSQPARLRTVEVGNIKSEFEVVSDLRGLLLVHLSHN